VDVLHCDCCGPRQTISSGAPYIIPYCTILSLSLWLSLLWVRVRVRVRTCDYVSMFLDLVDF
jgi:hypothetical protein